MSSFMWFLCGVGATVAGVFLMCLKNVADSFLETKDDNKLSFHPNQIVRTEEVEYNYTLNYNTGNLYSLYNKFDKYINTVCIEDINTKKKYLCNKEVFDDFFEPADNGSDKIVRLDKVDTTGMYRIKHNGDVLYGIKSLLIKNEKNVFIVVYNNKDDRRYHISDAFFDILFRALPEDDAEEDTSTDQDKDPKLINVDILTIKDDNP